MTALAARSPRPDARQRATIALLVLGMTMLVAVLVQLAWVAALSGGWVTAAASSLVVAHVAFGTGRVLLGAWLTVRSMERAFGCRPGWPLALSAHLAGTLLAKAALLGPSPAAATALTAAALIVPAWLIVRRAG